MLWPQPGDTAFAPGTDRKSAVDLDWFNTDNIGFVAEGFLTAGNLVVDGAAQSIFHADQFFFPAAYLYRHGIELQLKEFLRVGLPTPYSRSQEKVLGGHDLMGLWQLAKPLIQRRWPTGDSAIIDSAESVIQEFHHIDPSGQGFRYTHDKRTGTRYLQNAPRVLDIQNLKTVVGGVFAFLQGCTTGVGDTP